VLQLIDNIVDARRLAVAIVSEIGTQNEALVVRGLKEDNLFELLSDKLSQGRVLFERRVEPHFVFDHKLFERAIIDHLIFPMRKIGAPIF
jgi:hypothetical protein